MEASPFKNPGMVFVTIIYLLMIPLEKHTNFTAVFFFFPKGEADPAKHYLFDDNPRLSADARVGPPAAALTLQVFFKKIC